MTDNPALTGAARRMLAALNGVEYVPGLEDVLTNNRYNMREWANRRIISSNAAAEAAQERPAWVPVADVPEAWKDGRPLLGRVTQFPGAHHYKIEWWEADYDGWAGDRGDPLSTHLCDCIPRTET
jgi:hypothetical protein